MKKADLKVPFIDHSINWNLYKNNYFEIFEESLSSGQFQGDSTKLTHFENIISIDTGRNHTVLVGSGTEALYMSMRLINDNEKTEVVVPALSFTATASAIARTGKHIVFQDANIDCSCKFDHRKNIDNLINEKTNAIIVVNMYGYPASETVEESYKTIPVITDNAQGFVGNNKNFNYYNGLFNCLSFDPLKNLPAFGSAGAILCDNELFADSLRKLRKNSPDTDIPSQNSQVSSHISATLLYKYSEFFNEWYDKRQTIVKKYCNGIKSVNYNDNYSRLSANIFPLFHEDRNELKEYLSDKNIDTKIHYPYLLPELKQFGGMSDSEAKELYPYSYEASRTELSLPIYPDMTDEQIDKVIYYVNDFL